jgi:monoamine oxidase
LLPDDSGASDFLNAAIALDELAKEVPPDRPWTAARAAELDRQTLADFLGRTVSRPGARAIWDTAVHAVWAAEAKELSLLYVAAYVAGAGNETTPGSFLRLVTTGNGAQERRFAGGSQVVSERVADALGRRVRLREAVSRIAAHRGGVRVLTDRSAVEAKAVIVAIPPVLAGRIRYAPRLPADTRGLLRSAPPGHLIKAEAIYDRPFWRDAGLSGQVISDRGPADSTFDNSPQDGSVGILFGFGRGRAVRDVLRRAGALAARVLRLRLVQGALDAGVPDGDLRPAGAHPLRPRAGPAGRPDPLRRDGDRRALGGLHGRRRALRRARGPRGPAVARVP